MVSIFKWREIAYISNRLNTVPIFIKNFLLILESEVKCQNIVIYFFDIMYTKQTSTENFWKTIQNIRISAHFKIFYKIMDGIHSDSDESNPNVFLELKYSRKFKLMVLYFFHEPENCFIISKYSNAFNNLNESKIWKYQFVVESDYIFCDKKNTNSIPTNRRNRNVDFVIFGWAVKILNLRCE